MMTYPSDTLAFKKAEILKVMQNIAPNFDLGFVQGAVEKNLTESINYENETNFNDYRRFLFKMPLLSLWEAASIICGIDPALLDELNEYDAKVKYPDLSNALNFLNSSNEAGLIEFHNYKISKQEFQIFLSSQNIVISGYNEVLSKSNIYVDDLEVNQQHSEQFLQKYKQLETELAQAQELIKQLEAIPKQSMLEIQTNHDESKLGSKRAENNVTKLLLVLAEMANIDIEKPHAIHGSLQAQAELLGIDSFPSDETVKKWFKLALKHKDN